jgi:hypothetical protein
VGLTLEELDQLQVCSQVLQVLFVDDLVAIGIV